MNPSILSVLDRGEGPVRRCPRHAHVVLDGGPVLFHCRPYGHSVVAADLSHEFTQPGDRAAA